MTLWQGFPAFVHKSWGIFAIYFNKIPNKTDETCTQILFFTILLTKKSQNHYSPIGNGYLTEKTPHNFWTNFELSHLSAYGREGKVRGGYKNGSTFLFFVQRGFCLHPPHYNSAPCLVLLLSVPLLGCGGGSDGGGSGDDGATGLYGHQCMQHTRTLLHTHTCMTMSITFWPFLSFFGQKTHPKNLSNRKILKFSGF